MLYVTVRQGPLAFDVVSLHAPIAASPIQDVESFWNDVENMCAMHASNYPLIMGADINGKVGSVRSGSIGAHAADRESLSGSRFRQLLEMYGMVAPATMDGHVQGQAGTWLASNHKLHRIDFTAIPKACLNSEVVSRVDPDIDIVVQARDHYAQLLKFQLT